VRKNTNFFDFSAHKNQKNFLHPKSFFQKKDFRSKSFFTKKDFHPKSFFTKKDFRLKSFFTKKFLRYMKNMIIFVTENRTLKFQKL